jgi:hypothetical protein
VATAVVGGAGGEGSKDAESCRMEIAESASGWANGMKEDGGDSVDEVLRKLRGTAIGTPPMLSEPGT